MKEPKLQHLVTEFYLYSHPDPIQSINVDGHGNFLINGQYVKFQGKALGGYTVISHEMKNGKMLLRKDELKPRIHIT